MKILLSAFFLFISSGAYGTPLKDTVFKFISPTDFGYQHHRGWFHKGGVSEFSNNATTAGPDYKSELSVSASSANRQVVINVKDIGVGIPDAIMEKIYSHSSLPNRLARARGWVYP